MRAPGWRPAADLHFVRRTPGGDRVSEQLLKFIAWWQIMCGLLGIGPFAGYYFDLFPHGRAILEQQMGWINYFLGICFFSFAVVAGRSLLKREAWGLWASFTCQAAQVVSFAILHGPQVQVNAGPFLGVKLSDSQLRFSAGFESSFFLGTLISGPAFVLTVNVLALVWALNLLGKGGGGQGCGRPQPNQRMEPTSASELTSMCRHR